MDCGGALLGVCVIDTETGRKTVKALMILYLNFKVFGKCSINKWMQEEEKKTSTAQEFKSAGTNTKGDV